MIYALDTSVVSALRRRGPDDAPALEWARGVSQDLVYLPAIVLAEIRYGIALVERRGDVDQAARLDAWFQGLNGIYQDRVLDFTFNGAMVAGEILARPDAPGMADCLIAATARVHGATVVTRNGRDFARTGVEYMDLWRDSGT
ncbi:type II toxin-antitoxin system VapC family toxin [Demequina lignilytica]|uniref:Ribonuclease VapC n=1 Tax=Demequina lignilytica TaxID=3051663 RepID=A0AB35ME56_9MICO|nr:type II toxin-antitoxin system VapC family toxin [Demequina sp. SYSU T0a273]MDN4482039.1 type II toxin-antitoxin system VapC family toxin [Demequina sp. SYSU T0a273]